MGYARKSQISLTDTPYYHVVARCVRRAWLWGYDEYAGRDCSHRKAWVLERLTQFAAIFAIDICAYAVMSNHYHLVLFVDQLRAQQLTSLEVATRWTQIFGTPPLIAKYLDGIRAFIPGHTWHHNPSNNTMQLVPINIHDPVSHMGERAITRGRSSEGASRIA